MTTATAKTEFIFLLVDIDFVQNFLHPNHTIVSLVLQIAAKRYSCPSPRTSAPSAFGGEQIHLV